MVTRGGIALHLPDIITSAAHIVVGIKCYEISLYIYYVVYAFAIHDLLIFINYAINFRVGEFPTTSNEMN